MVSPNTFNITTLLLLSLTLWELWTRYRTKPENNWPLFYYIVLVLYAKKFEETLNPGFVYVAVVAALLIRFEFMSGWILKAITYIETACLGYVIIRCLQMIFGAG